MLFLQALLFFLLSTPALALFDIPKDTPSKEGSASGAQPAISEQAALSDPNQRPPGPRRRHKPSAQLAAAIPVEADNILGARGYWRHDYLQENKQMRRVMFVKGVGRGFYNKKDSSATMIWLGEVEITDAENLIPRPQSWQDLTLENIKDITNVEWNRYTSTDGNFLPGQLGQEAKCEAIWNKDDEVKVKITVHEPFPVQAPRSAWGDWYRDDSIRQIREVMRVRGMGNRRIILLGEVKITTQSEANDLPKSWKGLTSQDAKDIASSVWQPWTDPDGNVPPAQLDRTVTCKAIANKDGEATAVEITVNRPPRVRKKQKTG